MKNFMPEVEFMNHIPRESESDDDIESNGVNRRYAIKEVRDRIWKKFFIYFLNIFGTN